MHFFGPNALGNSFFLAHVKFKSKITYLGTGISRIHRQMTEQWSFEVTIKNVTNTAGALFYLFRIEKRTFNCLEVLHTYP